MRRSSLPRSLRSPRSPAWQQSLQRDSRREATNMMRALLLLVAIGAVAGAASIPFMLRRLRKQTGFVNDAAGGAVIIASDTGAASALVVRDESIGVCGKPDYIVEEQVNGRRLLVPVEVKPTRRGRRLYDGDRLQLGVYLL